MKKRRGVYPEITENTSLPENPTEPFQQINLPFNITTPVDEYQLELKFTAVANTSYTLWEIPSKFLVTYEYLTASVKVQTYNNQHVYVFTNVILPTDVYLHINKKGTVLSLTVNNALPRHIEGVNYVLPLGNINTPLSASFVRYTPIGLYPFQLIMNTGIGYRNPPNCVFAEVHVADAKQNYTILPFDKSASTYKEGITVLPTPGLSNIYTTLRGLVLLPNYKVKLPNVYTVDFRLTVWGTEDCTLISSTFYTINLIGSDIYFNGTVLLGGINRTDSFTLSIAHTDAHVLVSLNNSDPINIEGDMRGSGVFKLNYTQGTLVNGATTLTLHVFRMTIGNKLAGGTYPVYDALLAQQKNTPKYIGKHKCERLYTHVTPDFVNLTLSTAVTSVSRNVSFSVVVSRIKVGYAENAEIWFEFTKGSSVTAPGTVIPVLFNSSEITKTISLSVGNIADTELITGVQVYLSYGHSIQKLTLPYNAPSLPLSMLINAALVDGYFADTPTLSSLVSGTGSSTAIRKYYENLGYGYEVTPSTFLTLSSVKTNIKTAVFVYKETSPVVYRGYVGNDTLPTFNGGDTGQYAGPLQTSANTFVEVLNKTGLYDNVHVSHNGKVIVAIKSVVEIYRLVNDVWIATPDILDLQLQAPSSIASTSVDITPDGLHIALGFRNANNGEGVVQIWKQDGGVWVKQLHLSSPSLTPLGNFGHSVAISDDGQKLFVSEFNANKVRIYVKSSTWNSSPTQTLTGASGWGYEVHYADDVLLVGDSVTNSTDKYNANTYLFDVNFPVSARCHFDKVNKDIVFYNKATGLIRLYRNYTLHATLDRTFTEVALHENSYAITENTTVNLYKNGIFIRSFTKNTVPFYGSSLALSDDLLVINNFSDRFEVQSATSNNNASNVLSVVVNGINTAPSALLPYQDKDIDIIFMSFTTSLTVKYIGKTFLGGHLNGILLGALFYNRDLTTLEQTSIEKYIKYRLRIRENYVRP